MRAFGRSAAYAPRNALNAAALKAAIEARSQARGDADAIRAWLLNHFCRHLVANFEPARRIESLDEARSAWGEDPLPPWVAARFAAGTAGADGVVPIVWVAPDDPAVLALEARLVEFLGSRKGTALEGKLERINCPQALALWEREHAEMARRIDLGWRQSQPGAVKTILTTANGCFVEFLADSPLLRAEMAFESYAMRHCLGQFADRRDLTGGYGEHYAESVEGGKLRILSFRDHANRPHVTISVSVESDGRLMVEQVKGKQNRPPIERYVPELAACLDLLGTDAHTPPDCVAIGLVRSQAGWRPIAQVGPDEQLRLVAAQPALFRFLSAPAPIIEWLVAASQPEHFAERAPASTGLRYATRLLRHAPPPASAKVRIFERLAWPGPYERLDEAGS